MTVYIPRVLEAQALVPLEQIKLHLARHAAIWFEPHLVTAQYVCGAVAALRGLWATLNVDVPRRGLLNNEYSALNLPSMNIEHHAEIQRILF